MYYKGGGGNYGLQGYLGIAVPDISSSGSDPYGLTEGELDTQTRIAINNDGNVGIGTTSPIGNLSVVRDTVVAGSDTFQRGMFYKDGKLQITPPDLYNGYPLNGDFITTTRYKTDGTTDYTSAALGTDYDSNGSSSLYFKTAASASSCTEKVRILGNGNVGIGTTSPNAKLQVNGDIQLNDPEQPIGFGIYHGTHSTLDYFDTLLAKSLRRTADTTFEMQSDGSNAGFSAMDMQFRALRFYTGTTASASAIDVNITDLPSYERMCITGAGNVGIGTNAP